MPRRTPKPPPQPTSAYDNVVQINDELWIAQRTAQKTPTWYLFKLGEKWVRRSLGTQDQRQARALALKGYQAWLEDPESDWLAACGNTSHHVSFKEVAEAWLATQTKDHTYKAGVIRKFLVPYFHHERNVTSMTQVTEVVIEDYKAFRRSFWLTTAGNEEREATRRQGVKATTKRAESYEEPSPNTLNREYPTLRQILAYAEKRGYIAKGQAPDVPAEPATANPRPAFLGDDFNVLMREAEKWIQEATDDTTRSRRQLLADWIWVNRYTGLRVPHEAERVRWADVRLDVNLLYVAEDTKTGKREVPLREEAASRLRTMRQRREDHCRDAGLTFDETEPVFALPDGEPCTDFGRLFNQVVVRCNFPRRADQLPYSPYGLRHTFASFSLAEGKSYAWLQEAMGTSEKMLRTHYQQGTIEQTQRYLREKGLMPDQQPAATQHNAQAGKPLELLMEGDLPGDSPLRRRLVVEKPQRPR